MLLSEHLLNQWAKSKATGIESRRKIIVHASKMVSLVSCLNIQAGHRPTDLRKDKEILAGMGFQWVHTHTTAKYWRERGWEGRGREEEEDAERV